MDGLCARCHRQGAGREYSLHVMKVESEDWDKLKYGRKIWTYVPVRTVSEFQCSRCARLHWFLFQAVSAIWLTAYLVLLYLAFLGWTSDRSPDALHSLRALLWNSDTLSNAVLALGKMAEGLVIAGVFLAGISIWGGLFLIAEMGARLITPRSEIVEFRMLLKRRWISRLTTYLGYREKGKPGQTIVFTTAGRPKQTSLPLFHRR